MESKPTSIKKINVPQLKLSGNISSKSPGSKVPPLKLSTKSPELKIPIIALKK